MDSRSFDCDQDRLRGNDRVANAVFYYKNREHRKSTYKQQMHL